MPAWCSGLSDHRAALSVVGSMVKCNCVIDTFHVCLSVDILKSYGNIDLADHRYY